MSREIRMVPPDWEHPKGPEGRHKPLHNDLLGQIAEFEERQQSHGTLDALEYFGWLYAEEEYMPVFEDGTATHIRMYETCSEGTPISPALATPEELARWLADNDASAFGGMTATYEQWLDTVNRGFAIGMVMTRYEDGTNAMESGVAAMSPERAARPDDMANALHTAKRGKQASPGRDNEDKS